jgi:hypothetical protein
LAADGHFTLPLPRSAFHHATALAWLQLTTAEALPALLDQAVAAASLDWLIVCVPGIRFEPTFAALTLAAAASIQPGAACISMRIGWTARVNRVTHT